MAEEGDVLISRELASALTMLCGVGWLVLAGKWLFERSTSILRDGLDLDRDAMAYFEPASGGWALLKPLLLPLGALFGASLLAAIAAPALLGSLGWRSKAMTFKGNRLNPLAGVKRIFGLQGLTELIKALRHRKRKSARWRKPALIWTVLPIHLAIWCPRAVWPASRQFQTRAPLLPLHCPERNLASWRPRSKYDNSRARR